jgi:hypothetical protein
VDLLGHRPSSLATPQLNYTGNPTTPDRPTADNFSHAKIVRQTPETARRRQMSKRARKRRDRKKSSANHGKRPHS